MQELKIEILNPKAIRLIKDMQDLDLIKISEEPVSALKAYLKRTRKNSGEVPAMKDITKIVEEVRAKRYAKK